MESVEGIISWSTRKRDSTGYLQVKSTASK